MFNKIDGLKTTFDGENDNQVVWLESENIGKIGFIGNWHDGLGGFHLFGFDAKYTNEAIRALQWFYEYCRIKFGWETPDWFSELTKNLSTVSVSEPDKKPTWEPIATIGQATDLAFANGKIEAYRDVLSGVELNIKK